MSDTDIIWLLIFIGYAIGFIGIAILGILGTNEIVEFKNRQYKQEQIRQIGLSKAFEKAKKL
jgi:Trk-type K+ transport system membrane component|tara:strand:- start:205 stop:390 length:186 start_codon:yes stop_codon:yes gene_type:complete